MAHVGICRTWRWRGAADIMTLGPALWHAGESASAAAPGPPHCQDFPARLRGGVFEPARLWRCSWPFEMTNSLGHSSKARMGGGLGERPAKLEGAKLACVSLMLLSESLVAHFPLLARDHLLQFGV